MAGGVEVGGVVNTGMLRVRVDLSSRLVVTAAVAVVMAVLAVAGSVGVSGPAGPTGAVLSQVRRRTPPRLATLANLDAAFPARASAAPQAAVGPLLNPRGAHHCTASVVTSPGGDLLVTAAHCVYDGRGSRSGLRFAPGYFDGNAPYGIWQVADVFVDDQWAESPDPDDDVAFVSVRPLHGRTIEELTGAHALGIGYGPVNRVRVTGYPSDGDRPVSCTGFSRPQSATQMRFECAGITGGTSGGPWITGDGSVIGVIGGYQRGGDTASVSYSPRFGDRVKALYDTATNAE
jgi:V8-like Glu-specific endopeptidase